MHPMLPCREACGGLREDANAAAMNTAVLTCLLTLQGKSKVTLAQCPHKTPVLALLPSLRVLNDSVNSPGEETIADASLHLIGSGTVLGT